MTNPLYPFSIDWCCDYGACLKDATHVFSARATHVPDDAPATAERRPVCFRHMHVLMEQQGDFEVWDLQSGDLVHLFMSDTVRA